VGTDDGFMAAFIIHIRDMHAHQVQPGLEKPDIFRFFAIIDLFEESGLNLIQGRFQEVIISKGAQNGSHKGNVVFNGAGNARVLNFYSQGLTAAGDRMMNLSETCGCKCPVVKGLKQVFRRVA
jgi:hypothetical protein